MDTTCCPECGEIAEVRERSVLESTDGPIEHAKIVCVEHHWFLMPLSYLHSAPAPSRNPRIRSPR